MHPRRPRGFTLIELMVVIMIVGVIALTVMPRASKTIARVELKSAKREVTAALTVARSVAVQTGRPSRLKLTGDSIRVYLQNNGAFTQVGGVVETNKAHKVTLSMVPDSVRFDARGYAFGINGASNYQVIRLTRGTLTDSVCVSKFGRVVAKGSCT